MRKRTLSSIGWRRMFEEYYANNPTRPLEDVSMLIEKLTDENKDMCKAALDVIGEIETEALSPYAGDIIEQLKIRNADDKSSYHVRTLLDLLDPTALYPYVGKIVEVVKGSTCVWETNTPGLVSLLAKLDPTALSPYANVFVETFEKIVSDGWEG